MPLGLLFFLLGFLLEVHGVAEYLAAQFEQQLYFFGQGHAFVDCLDELAFEALDGLQVELLQVQAGLQDEQVLVGLEVLVALLLQVFEPVRLLLRLLVDHDGGQLHEEVADMVSRHHD